MIRALYTAQTGMNSSQFQLDVVSNNLANVNTKGYKRSNGEFADLVYQKIRAPGSQLPNGAPLPTGLDIGSGAAPIGTVRIHTQGSLQQTEQQLDWAIVGDGFFTIQLPDGTTAYTRNGEFKRNANGDIVTTDGYQLVPNVNIPANAMNITVSNAGLVQFTLPNDPAPQSAGTLQLTTFINPQGLESAGGNLYLQTGASGDPQTGDPQTENFGQIRQGFLELSNVNVTEALIDMITAQRGYELDSKAVSAADHMLKVLYQIGG